MARKPKAAAPPDIEEGPAPIGDNSPPEPIEQAELTMTAEQWLAWMDQRLAPALTRITDLLDADARFKANFELKPPAVVGGTPIGIEKWNDDVYARCAALREKWRDVIKLIENIHSIEKAPILVATRVIDNAKNRLLAKIQQTDTKGRLLAGADAPLNRLRDRTTIYANWLEQERRREAVEEAERLRLEAEAQAAKAAQTSDPQAFDQAAEAFAVAEQAQEVAEARPSERTMVYGAEGGRMHLTGRWSFVEAESDLMKLVKAVAAGEAKLEFLSFNTSRIGYAVRSEQVRDVPGCVIREVFST